MKKTITISVLSLLLFGCATSVNISIDSNRPARVLLNGEDLGETPIVKSLSCDTSTYWKTINGQYSLEIVATPSQEGVVQRQVVDAAYLCQKNDGDTFKVFFNMNLRPIPSQQHIDLRMHNY